MARTDLKIVSVETATQDKITTTIGYVNQTATSAKLKQLAEKLNALTTNQYHEANRVNTLNVDSEEVPDYPEAEITFTQSSFNAQDLINGGSVKIGSVTINNSYNVLARYTLGAHLSSERADLGTTFDLNGNIYLVSTPSLTTLPTGNITLYLEYTGYKSGLTSKYKPQLIEVTLSLT